MKKLCEKKGMKAVQMAPGETDRLKKMCMPLRDEWVKQMEKRGLPGQAVLDAAVKLSANRFSR
jgi:hypothetical protein